MELTKEKFVELMTAAKDAVEAHKDELSALDGATGDGDHGIAICEAMNAAIGAVKPEADFKSMLNDMGFGVMMATSGSISTLLGSLLLGMSEAADKESLSADETAAVFSSGLANMRTQTKADVGDKTMMDALIPAVAALEEAKGQGLAVMFAKAADAADAGRAKTADMVAKFGRAKNLGERVVGHIDAGATSITYIFKAFAETLAN